MNKLLITAVLVSAGFASCYKEKAPPDVKGLLVGHKWYLSEKLIENYGITTECELSAEATFRNDSTGYFYNATPCDTNIAAPDSVSFNWVLSTDKKNIYFTNVGGDMTNFYTYRVAEISDNRLRISGADVDGHIAVLIYLKNE
jgi:hypothetical protein